MRSSASLGGVGVRSATQAKGRHGTWQGSRIRGAAADESLNEPTQETNSRGCVGIENKVGEGPTCGRI